MKYKGLHLFDDGGDSGATSEAAAQNGQEMQNVPAQEGPTFDELIGKGGKYEKDYNDRVATTVKSRLKSTKAELDRLKGYMPAIELMGQRLGLDGADPDQLLEAMQNDEEYYEQKALAEGMPTDKYRELENLQLTARQAERLEAQRVEQEKNNRYWSTLIQQGEQLKGLYPGFDFDKEMTTNPQFAEYMSIRNPATGEPALTVKQAFEQCHLDEIMSGAMQYAVQTSQAKIANSIQANQRRPSENGSGAQSPATTKIDPSKLTLKDFEEIKKRVARGENISF